MTTRAVVILGAGSAGIAAARTLAQREDIGVTLVTRTGETPYTRMLIKGVALGPTPPELIRLPLPEVSIVADSAVSIDPGAGEVRLASGTRLGYDALILATGSRPRTLGAEVGGVETAQRAGRLGTLHSLEDALWLRGRLDRIGEPARVVIYGGGVIAAETASTLCDQGHRVTLVARSGLPGAGAFGLPVARRIAAEHAVRLGTRFGRRIRRLDTAGDGVIVTLDDDSSLPADVLVLALGTIAVAPTPWEAGVDVDDRLRARAPRVYAAGGVATHHDALGTWRIDHWEDAAAQGGHAALAALGDLGVGEDPGPYRPRSPYLAMVHGQAVAGIGLTSHAETRVEDGEEFLVRHEFDDAVIGVSGVDAVATVYQWGPRLHGVSRQRL